MNRQNFEEGAEPGGPPPPSTSAGSSEQKHQKLAGRSDALQVSDRELKIVLPLRCSFDLV